MLLLIFWYVVKYSRICCFKIGQVSSPKIGLKPKNRVLDAVNDVLFSKIISNKFTTVHNIVFNMFLCCNSIPKFVASRYARFRVQKSTKNARKRVLDSAGRVLDIACFKATNQQQIMPPVPSKNVLSFKSQSCGGASLRVKLAPPGYLGNGWSNEFGIGVTNQQQIGNKLWYRGLDPWYYDYFDKLLRLKNVKLISLHS